MLFTAAPSPSGAEGNLGGKFRLGYRAVDVSGSEARFREDIDLDDGLRLFELRLDWRAVGDTKTLADRIELDLSGLGGDPFESLQVSVVKRGLYDLSFDRSRAASFYDDVLLPNELSTPGLSEGGDFHRFDFDRVRDDLQLDLDLGTASKLQLGLERVTRKGDGTTTFDVGGDEFVLDQRVDEKAEVLALGFEHAWRRTTLVLEERRRRFENTLEAILPEPSSGLDPFDATQLEVYRWLRPRSFDSHEHRIRLVSRPTDSLRVRLSALWQELEMDVTGSETGRGNDGASFEVSRHGRGQVDRDAELFDVDLDFRLTPRVALVAGLRRHRLDQRGLLPFGDELQAGVWNLSTTGGELGIEANVTTGLTVSAGLQSESRDLKWAEASGGPLGPRRQKTTDHRGFFATVAWRPDDRLRLDAEVEDSTYDDPFSFTAPSDQRRARLRARFKGHSGLYGEGTWLSHRLENEVYDWRSDRDQWTLRIGYRRTGLDVSLAGSTITTERRADRLLIGVPDFVTIPFPVLYGGDAEFLEGRLRWRVSNRLQLGAEARFYDHRGALGIERSDLRGWFEAGLGYGLLVGLAYRRVDFDETQANVELYDGDDYLAEWVELSIGRRW